jgi:hypothetical protein
MGKSSKSTIVKRWHGACRSLKGIPMAKTPSKSQPAPRRKAGTTTASRSEPRGKSAAPGGTPTLDPEHIRARAYEIYARRTSEGTPGDAESDWLEAQEELRAKAATRVAKAVRGRRTKATKEAG